MQQVRILPLLFLMLCLGCADQITPNRPTAKQPGKASLQTGLLIYVSEPNDDPVYILLAKVKDSYEKSILYFGENKPWKNKSRPKFQLPFSPPNSVPIADMLTLDISEVPNISYLEFLHIVSIDSSKEKAASYFPSLNQEALDNYFLNPEFYYYPVVGITKEQAEDYCKWRAQIVNLKLTEYYSQENNRHKDGRFYQLTGRLPTYKEWMIVGKTAYQDLDTVTTTVDKKTMKYILENKELLKYSAGEISEEDQKVEVLGANLSDTKPDYLSWKIPFYIFTYKPSLMDFYNLIGNVAEIVQDGYALGGSYNTQLKDVLIEKKQAPANDVGFRCVCEIKRKSN